jgi:nitroreductase
LALGIAKRSFTRNGRENRSALHDLGQATANLTLEATARGLYVHQMAGIDLDRARELYQVPEDFAVVTAFAIGYLGHESAPAQRSRKPLNDLVFTKSFGTAAGF